MQVDISGITALTQDRKTSIRLYRKYRSQHLNQTPQWVVQKVIFDLERDRGVATAKTKNVRTRGGKSTGNKSEWLKEWVDRNPRWVSVGTGLFLLLIHLSQNENSLGGSQSQSLQPSNTLDAPGLRQQLESGSMLTIQNEVPEPVKVTLTNPETDVTYSFALPAYPQGRHYLSSETLPQGCSENAPVRSIPVQPGTYRATMQYAGTTRTESGMWTMVDGWEQFGCYYSIRYDNDDPR